MHRFRLALFAALLAALLAGPAFAFDGIRVTLLGTGGALPSLERSGPATLVEAGSEVLLFDCGHDVAQRLTQAGVALKDVSAVFLTHLHSDHVVGFPDLWLTGLQRGRMDPIPVFGPDGTVDMMRHIEQAFRIDLASRLDASTQAAGIDAHDIAENVVYQSEDVTVTAFVVDHGSIQPAYGYRIDYGKRRSVVISGDTRYSENLIRNARDAQLLVHEVAAADPELLQTSARLSKLFMTHSSPEDAARVFRQARPYLAIYSHIMLLEVSEDDLLRRTHAGYSGAVQVGSDLMVIEIQNEVQVRGAPSEPRQSRH
jgi:ribonuclease Z